MTWRAETIPLRNGRWTTIVFNEHGRKVADIQDHTYTGEELEMMTRQLVKDHPELFGDEILVDTADESVNKNPGAYGEGKLSTVPGN